MEGDMMLPGDVDGNARKMRKINECVAERTKLLEDDHAPERSDCRGKRKGLEKDALDISENGHQKEKGKDEQDAVPTTRWRARRSCREAKTCCDP